MHKSPGPDGFTSEVYIYFRDVALYLVHLLNGSRTVSNFLICGHNRGSPPEEIFYCFDCFLCYLLKSSASRHYNMDLNGLQLWMQTSSLGGEVIFLFNFPFIL